MTCSNDEKRAKVCGNTDLILKAPKDVSDIIGHFGGWQQKICLAVLYFEFIGAIANLSSPLLVPEVPYVCDLNDTRQRLLQAGDKSVTLVPSESQCTVTYRTEGGKAVTPCRKWIYSHEEYQYSFTEEWNLVCDNAWLLSFSNTVTILGDLIACCVFGYISDRFGRRRTLLLLVFPVLAGTLVTLFASNVQMFLVGRFLLGAGGHGGLVISFVLLMECVGSSRRASVGIAVKMGWSVGAVFAGLLAYWLRNSFKIQMALSAASALLIPVAFFLPESPRWLLISNRVDGLTKATDVLRHAAKLNGGDVTEVADKVKGLSWTMHQQRKATSEKYDFWDLVKTPNMRLKTLVVTFLCAINSFSYYGITLLSARLGANPTMAFILISAVEIPALVTANPLAHYKGYKVSMLCGYLVNAVVFAISSGAKIDSGWSVVFVIVLAKFGVVLSNSCLGIYGSEIFPTVVRSLGLGTCAIVSRILALLSPFLKEMAQECSMSAVFLLLACLCVTCFSCVLFLPETYRKPFPETLEDAENIGLESPWKTWRCLQKSSVTFRIRRV